MRTYISWLPPHSLIKPDWESHLLSIQPRLGGEKGEGEGDHSGTSGTSAASEVGTRGLLFASSEGFIALMSARWSLRPRIWPSLLTSATRSSRSNSSSPATFTSTWFLSKLHEGLKTMLLLKYAPPNPVGQRWGRPLCFIYVLYRVGGQFFYSFFFSSFFFQCVKNEQTLEIWKTTS